MVILVPLPSSAYTSIGLKPTFFNTSSFVNLNYLTFHMFTPAIALTHLLWKDLSLVNTAVVRAHASQPYNNNERTTAAYTAVFTLIVIIPDLNTQDRTALNLRDAWNPRNHIARVITIAVDQATKILDIPYYPTVHPLPPSMSDKSTPP